MSASNESLGRVMAVAFALCVVCSVVVSTAAVALKPAQEANKTRDLKRNILQASGLYDPELSVEAQFEQIETRVVDLQSGRFTDDPIAGFDQRARAKDPDASIALSAAQDTAGILRRSTKALVYTVSGADGEIEKVILPVHGPGLWSTLYGFVALESDMNTIAGLGFYEHGETPGLGGEVDNPRWKSLWPGKQVFRDGRVAIAVIKGAVDNTSASAGWQVDGLSGASLTTRGVNNLVQFWLGADGFEPFLNNLRNGEA